VLKICVSSWPLAKVMAKDTYVCIYVYIYIYIYIYIYMCLHIYKVPIIIVRFHQSHLFFDRFFHRYSKYKILCKSVYWEVNCSMRAGGRTDRHNEIDSLFFFLQICKIRLKCCPVMNIQQQITQRNSWSFSWLSAVTRR